VSRWKNPPESKILGRSVAAVDSLPIEGNANPHYKRTKSEAPRKGPAEPLRADDSELGARSNTGPGRPESERSSLPAAWSAGAQRPSRLAMWAFEHGQEPCPSRTWLPTVSRPEIRGLKPALNTNAAQASHPGRIVLADHSCSHFHARGMGAHLVFSRLRRIVEQGYARQIHLAKRSPRSDSASTTVASGQSCPVWRTL
jgi:hypothetical protein